MEYREKIQLQRDIARAESSLIAEEERSNELARQLDVVTKERDAARRDLVEANRALRGSGEGGA